MSRAVFVNFPIPEEFAAELRKHFVAHLHDARLDEEQRSRVQGIVTKGGVRVDAALMAQFPQLEIVATVGIGVDAIDFTTTRARGIVVTNTPGVVSDDVADLAMAMLIDRLRRVVRGDRYIRDGQWPQEPFPLARSVSGKTIGIVGFGGIGQAVARRAEAFNLNVKWYGPRPKPDVRYEYVPDLVQLARDSDALIVACIGGPETLHLVNAAVIAALGPQGILINVSRGSVVDTTALIAALRAGQLGGAALDVVEGQPQVPPELLAFDNVLLTPHIGTATIETRRTMTRLALESMLDHFAGRRPKHLVP